jgi:hypothetical protein
MSGTKRTIFKQLFSQTAVTTTFSTAPTDTQGVDNLSYELIFANATNTPSGYFTLQGADAGTILPNQTMSGATWTPLTLSAIPQVDSASGSHLVSITQFPFRFVRLVYTPNSGQADITVNIYGKEL